MPAVTITIDPVQLKELQETLSGISNGLNRAISGAVNKVLPAIRKGFVDDVQGHVFLSPTEIRKCIAIKRASPSRPEGEINIARVPVKASRYLYTPATIGVRIQFGPGRVAQFIKHSFVAKMSSGHIGIYKRGLIGHRVVRYATLASAGAVVKGRKSGKALKAFGKRYSSWLPIKEVYGPTVQGVVTGAPKMLENRIVAAEGLLREKLADQVDRLLERKKPDESVPND
jgi:hypothetical protein